MVRMPDEKGKNPFEKVSSILKRNPLKQNEADEEVNEADAQREEEKVKEIIRRQVVKY